MTEFTNLKGHVYNLEFEKYLLKNEDILSWMDNLLRDNQFTEDFLTKTSNHITFSTNKVKYLKLFL